MELITIEGNVGRDPEVTTLDNGKVITTFSVAVNKDYKNKEGDWVKNPAKWYEVKLWDRTVEFVKGSHVRVEGIPDVSTYQDKEGGVKVSRIINARRVKEYVRRERISTQAITTKAEGTWVMPSNPVDSDNLPF